MTATEMIALIGSTKVLRSKEDGLSFEVTILDIKQAYGAYRVEVQPVAGSGSTWVSLDRIK